ncbi:MAG TPA: MFS transporter, partial [Rhizomicrobium sp.]|nr:MFS transporter [Rhizomicrobium sp.]
MTDAVVYRERDFRVLLASRFLTTIATQVQSVAVGWQVYEISRSPMALGFVGLAEFVPMFLLVLPAGDITDRTDQRKVLSIALIVQAISAALLL